MTPRHFPWSLRRKDPLGETYQDIHDAVAIGLIGNATGAIGLIIIAIIVMSLA